MGTLKKIKFKMMNIKIFALFALLMIACAAAASPVQTLPVQKTGKSTASLKIVRANGWCATCVNFVEQALHELIEIIINGGVLGGCGDLCSKLSNHLEATICDLVCDVVGIEAFIKLLQTLIRIRFGFARRCRRAPR